MQCSVGVLVSDCCTVGKGLLNVSNWPEKDRNLLLKRVQGHIRRPLYKIDSCCDKHYANFIPFYDAFQETLGCCDPFLLHASKTALNLEYVTLELEESVFHLFPFVLQGMKICLECKDGLSDATQMEIDFAEEREETNKEQQSDLHGIVSEEYRFEEIDKLYQETMKIQSLPMFDSLRPLQAESIHKLLLGKDLLCVLATNYGKTAIIVLPGLIYSKFYKKKSISVIIMPMNDLMNKLMVKLADWNLKAAVVTLKEVQNGNIKRKLDEVSNEDPFYLLSNPENLLHTDTRKLLLKENVKFILADEVHTVPEWSTDFRPSFGKIGRLRLFLDCPMGLFTATLTKGMFPVLMKKAGINQENLSIVSNSPDRPEIYLEVRPMKKLEDDIQFLVDEAETLKLNMPRTIVFLKATTNTSDTNIDFRLGLSYGGEIYKNGELWDYISNHLSTSIDQITKNRIIHAFEDPDSFLRVLFSTIVYGMGMDNKTIARVVIHDADCNPASLLQKIGRASRDGGDGHAIIYSTPKMRRTVLEDGKCIRACLLSKLMGYTEKGFHELCQCKLAECKCMKCLCCSTCRSLCSCRKTSECGNGMKEINCEDDNFGEIEEMWEHLCLD